MSDNEISDKIASGVNDLISQVSQQTNLGADAKKFEDIGGNIENIDQIGDLIHIGKDGDMREQNLIQLVDDSFLPPSTSIHQLCLSDLQQLPRHLSDTVLSKELPIGFVGRDHYSYWAWTAAVVSYVHGDGRMIVDDPSDFESPFANFNDLLSDYYSLIHLVLMPLRHRSLEGRTKIFFSSMNPNIGKLDEKQTLLFASNTGFRLLEGLIRRHSDIVNLNGKPNEEYLPIGMPWESTNDELHEWSDNQRLFYETELHIWREYSTLNKSVKYALDSINDMNRNIFDVDDILRKFGKDKNTMEQIWKQSNTTKNFFDILAKKRNYTLHGRGSTQIAGVLILNLCSLILWDAMSDLDYDMFREKLLQKQLTQYLQPHVNMILRASKDDISSSRSTMQPDRSIEENPANFYPLFSSQMKNIIDLW